MANRISLADGNFTDAASWATIDSTFLVVGGTSYTALTTSLLASTAFQPGAVTVDGVAIKIGALQYANPTNKMTLELYNATGAVVIKTVLVNCSDLPPASSVDYDGGWAFLKFDAPVLLVAATNYQIRLKLDSTSSATWIQTNGTANNWQHMLRIPGTTGAPAAGDNLHIMGELVAPDNVGTTPATWGATRVITMDNTATTDFGDGANANEHLPGFSINSHGTLAWGYAAGVQYYLKVSGDFLLYCGGMMTMGTVANPIPRDGSAILDFDCLNANTRYYFRPKGTSTVIVQGLSRTAGKDIWNCKLNGDLAVAGVTANVDTDTGWLNGDEVAFAPTRTTYTEMETRPLNGNAGATSFAFTGGASYVHSGTTPAQAEVILLSRNVKLRWPAAWYAGVVWYGRTIADCAWVFFDGGQAWTGPQTGSINFQYCSWRLTVNTNLIEMANAAVNNFTFEHCCFYAINNTSYSLIWLAATTGVNYRINDCITIGGNIGFNLADNAGYIDNLVSSGAYAQGIYMSDATDPMTMQTSPTLVAHSNQSNGIRLSACFANMTFTSIVAWRNATGGLCIGPGTWTNAFINVTFSNVELFGNVLKNLELYASHINTRILGGSLAGDSSFATTNGIYRDTNTRNIFCELTFDNVTLGKVEGIKVAHTNDVHWNGGWDAIKLLFRNCLLASATEFAGLPTNIPYCPESAMSVRCAKHDQTVGGSHKMWTPRGWVACENTTFRTAAPSEKLSPLSATFKLESGVKRVAVANSGVVTISCYVRKDASYNGTAPRLMQKANPAIGLSVDTQIAATVLTVTDTWYLFTGFTGAVTDDGVCEFVVDCDGTAGNIFTDDWSAS